MASITTPKARLSYPALFEPREGPGGGEAKYGCCLVFEAGTDLSALRQAAKDAARAKWGDRTDGLLNAGKLRLPFRDGEEKYGPGTTFINVTSKQRPGVVDRCAGPDGKPVAITDPEIVYPGCHVRASLRVFAYDRAGNKGVSFWLNGVQKLRDGDRLDGRAGGDLFTALETSRAGSDDSNNADLLN